MSQTVVFSYFFCKLVYLPVKQVAAEGSPQEDKNDLRLVFEIEYVGQLFTNYKPVELKIWRTYTDTTIEELRKIIDAEDRI